MRARTAAGMVVFSAVLLAAGGCGTPPGYRGVPTGEVTRTVNVFYATDRLAESTEPGKRRYGSQRAYDAGSGCELGVCQVEISRERNNDKPGSLPKSSRRLVNITSTDAMPEGLFYDRLREMMWYAGENETFVFVHGFNNSFESAVTRTAELWYDLGFEGPPITFTWPSRGGVSGVFGYFADSETIKWSVDHLASFLVNLVDETSPQRLASDKPARIHLIAHSMGTRLLTQALLAAADEVNRREQPIFCDVVLAAPDIDRDLFRDVIVLDLLRSNIAEHYTLYASSSDNVIKTSETLQAYPRAGDADEGLVAVAHDHFDTIDASAIQGGWLSMNHDYFITEPRVLQDLIELLRRGNHDPASYGRAMSRRDDQPGAPWVLLPDDVTGAASAE